MIRRSTRVTVDSIDRICRSAEAAMFTECMYKFRENALCKDEIEAFLQLLEKNPGLCETNDSLQRSLRARQRVLQADPEQNRIVQSRSDELTDMLLENDAKDQPNDSDCNISEAEEVTHSESTENSDNSSYSPSHSGNDVSDDTSWTTDLSSSVTSV